MKLNKIKLLLLALLCTVVANTSLHAVKIGVLHSLSGTMAISETSLKDVVMMAVKEINESGGVLGEKIEAVVVDPASSVITENVFCGKVFNTSECKSILE